MKDEKEKKKKKKKSLHKSNNNNKKNVNEVTQFHIYADVFTQWIFSKQNEKRKRNAFKRTKRCMKTKMEYFFFSFAFHFFPHTNC